jgi:hypothetical protein
MVGLHPSAGVSPGRCRPIAPAVPPRRPCTRWSCIIWRPSSPRRRTPTPWAGASRRGWSATSAATCAAASSPTASRGAMHGLRARPAPGLLLQGSEGCALLQRTAHGGGGGPPDRRGDPAPPRPAVGAIRAQAASALAAPDERGASAVLGIFLRALRSALRDASPGAPDAVRDAQLGAISFPQRFGSSLPSKILSIAGAKHSAPPPCARSRRCNLRRSPVRGLLPRGHRTRRSRRGSAGPHGAGPRPAVVHETRAAGSFHGGRHANVAGHRGMLRIFDAPCLRRLD